MNAKRPKRRPPPGSQFRLQYDLQDKARTTVHLYSKDYEGTNERPTTPARAVFDELVISPFCHIEQMDNSSWWIRICNRCFWVHVGRSGKAQITHEETRD